MGIDSFDLAASNLGLVLDSMASNQGPSVVVP